MHAACKGNSAWSLGPTCSANSSPQHQHRSEYALRFPGNNGMAGRTKFRGESGKPFLQEATIKSGVVGDDEYGPPEQIVHGPIIYALAGDHLIGNAGNVRDLRRDRKAGI